jgi:hypothetical protein
MQAIQAANLRCVLHAQCPAVCFLEPDEKDSALLGFTETVCNYKHEFKQVDIIAAAKNVHPSNSLASGERSFSAPMYCCGCECHNSGLVCSHLIDDQQPGNSWFASELRKEQPGGCLDAHIHRCGVHSKDQTITEEVKHSPQASDQTVQAYITNVVTVVHEEVFDILEEHNKHVVDFGTPCAEGCLQEEECWCICKEEAKEG